MAVQAEDAAKHPTSAPGPACVKTATLPQRTRKTIGVHTKKKGRLRCHKRPKSREETPKEGSDSGVGVGGRYRIPLAKTIVISGSIERKGSRTDTKVYGVRPQGRALPQWVPKQTCRPVGSMSPLPLPAQPVSNCK